MEGLGAGRPIGSSIQMASSDDIPPAPFLTCDPSDSVDGSGVLVEPHAIDEQFRKAQMPFFCRGKGVVHILMPLDRLLMLLLLF